MPSKPAMIRCMSRKDSEEQNLWVMPTLRAGHDDHGIWFLAGRGGVAQLSDLEGEVMRRGFNGRIIRGQIPPGTDCSQPHPLPDYGVLVPLNWYTWSLECAGAEIALPEAPARENLPLPKALQPSQLNPKAWRP